MPFSYFILLVRGRSDNGLTVVNTSQQVELVLCIAIIFNDRTVIFPNKFPGFNILGQNVMLALHVEVSKWSPEKTLLFTSIDMPS